MKKAKGAIIKPISYPKAINTAIRNKGPALSPGARP